jgi:YfiH family protein
MAILRAEWPAPGNVRALMTTRAEPSAGGEGADRAALVRLLQLPSEPHWLRQVHGAGLVRVPGEAPAPEADASYTTQPGVVCVAQAADCLPVLFCNDAGTLVAAAHAGWRGLCAGVLEATVRALPERPGRLMAWLGAAIGPASFEVGVEVREAFIAVDPDAAQHFCPLPRQSRESGDPGKYLADLYGLARQRLGRAGVVRVHGGGLDTHADPARFHSFRRDRLCGRQCAMAWLTQIPSEE